MAFREQRRSVMQVSICPTFIRPSKLLAGEPSQIADADADRVVPYEVNLKSAEE
jgi:hypothetical protein